MNTKDYIFIKKKISNYVKIKYDDITHIQSDGDYCHIFTMNNKYLIYHSLASLINKLPKDKFDRCHQRYIVNLDNIQQIQDSTIYMGSNVVLIRQAYLKILLKKLNYISMRPV